MPEIYYHSSWKSFTDIESSVEHGVVKEHVGASTMNIHAVVHSDMPSVALC